MLKIFNAHTQQSFLLWEHLDKFENKLMSIKCPKYRFFIYIERISKNTLINLNMT
jgi:hypothetical protein